MIYIDTYFFFNTIMDGVALLLAGLCASETVRFPRLIASALFGGAVSVIALLLELAPLEILIAAFLSFFPMVLLAFGKKRIRRLALVSLMAFISSLFLGGAAEAVSYFVSSLGGQARMSVSVFLILLFLGFGGFTLFGKSLYRKMDTSIISLSISFQGKEAAFFGLVDSGCLLRDPEKGREVILLKGEYAADLLPEGLVASLRLGVPPREEGFVPVPIRTASGKTVLFAFLPNFVCLHPVGSGKRAKRLREVLIALDFSDGGFAGCPCLVPLSVL